MSIFSHGPGLALVHVARKKEQERRRKKGTEMKPIVKQKNNSNQVRNLDEENSFFSSFCSSCNVSNADEQKRKE